MNHKKLGIILDVPGGGVGARLALLPEQERALRAALLADLFSRLSKLKKVSATLFHAGEDGGAAGVRIPRGYALARQAAGGPADRFESAFRVLLDEDGSLACVIGSQSPDVPLVYLKRAYVKLKHRDVVLGPALGGGLYLIGLKKLVPGLFEGLPWGEPELLGEFLLKVAAADLSCSLLPPWYEVNTPESFSFFETMILARKIEKKERLSAVERVLESMRAGQR